MRENPHKSAVEAKRIRERKRKEHEEKHGTPMPVSPVKVQKTMKAFVVPSEEDKESTSSPPPSAIGTLSTPVPQAVSTEIILTTTPVLHASLLKRKMFLQENSSLKSQLEKTVPSKICLGCLEWKDLIDDKLQHGLSLYSKYYCGISNSGYGIRVVKDTRIYSLFSTKCTNSGE